MGEDAGELIVPCAEPEPEPSPHPADGPARSSEEAAITEISAFLRERTGRDVAHYKRATIARRVARRMRVNEVDSAAAYMTFLRLHPEEAGALLQELSNSVAHFFRDPVALAALEREIPRFFENKTAADTIRVWVPGCATGEEAYSIAMLFREQTRTFDAPPVVQIFATDSDRAAVNQARAAFFSCSISADVSSERLLRFFVKEHQGYRVRREVREMLLFAAHDLLEAPPFSRLDLVSCRNLWVHWNATAQRRALEIAHFALRPEGRLFMGAAKSADGHPELFQPLDEQRGLYEKRPSARSSVLVAAVPGNRLRAAAGRHQHDVGASLARRTPTAPMLDAPPAPHSADDARVRLRELHSKLIEHFAAPSLLVSGEDDVLHLSEGASSFLHFGGGEPSTNLFRLVHPLLRAELRAAVFRARQTGEPAIAFGVPRTDASEGPVVDIRVWPASDLAADCLLITFDAHRPPEEGHAAVPPTSVPAAVHLENELGQTKRYLREVLDQHKASTEEWRAGNEELQAMNEELRSTSEALESSREDLQSTNEELTIVNRELHTKLDELALSNGDLHNLMSAIATVFLDRELCVLRFTPAAAELFNFIPSDVGRPLSHLQHTLIYPELYSDAVRVLQRLSPVEREVGQSAGRYFLARLSPYRTTDDRIAGVVLTFVDVTKLRLAEQAAQRARSELEDRVRQRTAQLDEANATLRLQVSKQQEAELVRQGLQRRLINAQEDERRRVSRELHDEVGQQIVAMMLSIKALEHEALSVQAAAKLRALRQAAEHVGTEIHQLASQLRPVVLDALGLSLALAAFLEGWRERSGIAVGLWSSGIDDPRLPSALEVTLYRIVQEATNNVVRHAEARNVSVSIERRKDYVIGVIEDDGKGFDLDVIRASKAGRLGIAGMQERAAIVDGVLTIDSGPAGTTVRVELPIPPS